MAKIVIREKDLTGASISSGTNDIAYVPGFYDLGAKGAQEISGPMLCSSVSQFKYYFGEEPQKFIESDCLIDNSEWTFLQGSTVNYYMCQTATKDGSGNTLYADPGYMYALSLIQNGIPVYYHGMNDCNKAKETVNYDGSATGTVFAAGKNIDLTVSGGVHTSIIVTDAAGNALAEGTNYSIDDSDPTAVKILNAASTPYIYVVTYTYSLSDVSTFSYPAEPKSFYKFFSNLDNIEMLKDRGNFSFKYFTSGGYPVFEYTNGTANKVLDNILDVVAPENDESDDNPAEINQLSTGRGDVLFFLDHLNLSDRPLWGNDSVFASVNNKLANNNKMKYCTMLTPWGKYPSATFGNVIMPGSFAYLISVAYATKNYGSGSAVAGVAKGAVAGFVPLTKQPLTNTIANKYQINTDVQEGVTEIYKVSINAITKINPYGYVIWGNRTLATKSNTEGVKATGYCNVRSIICDIKKRVYTAARRYMFEQNSDILWINFRQAVVPMLEDLKNGNQIAEFTFKKGVASGRSKLYVEISITPIYPLEQVDCTIELVDDILIETETN